jgi:nicotinate-nucleotide--dimethylbenzimidazole phosphoribosyltransferase
MLLFAADHGLADHGVSQYPKVVTREMLRNLSTGGAAINAICNSSGMDLSIFDVGVDTTETFPNIQASKVESPNGTTSSLSHKAAMTEKQFQEAFETGRISAESAILEQKVNTIGIGELGIGNTAVSSILLAAVSGRSAQEVTGAGTGVFNQKYENKVEIVSKVVEAHIATIQSKNYRNILLEMGGLEIA